MKKIILITSLALALPLLANAEDKNFMVYCPATYHNAKHGIVNITSNHGVSIRNMTALPQVYHVTFENGVYYGNRAQLPITYTNAEIMVPNAHVEFDVTVQSKKEFHYGVVPIGKNAYFEKSGKYKLLASTTIKLNNYVVATCIDYNVADIY